MASRMVERMKNQKRSGGIAGLGRKPGTEGMQDDARRAVMAAVQTEDRPSGESIAWHNWLTLLASAAYDTLPGSPEREKALDDALKTAPDHDHARKFAELALDGLDRFLRRK